MGVGSLIRDENQFLKNWSPYVPRDETGENPFPSHNIFHRDYWVGVGKHYLNRTSVLNYFLLDSDYARVSNKVKSFVADQALVREGDSRRNPVPLLANHKKFIRSALFLVNKYSG